MIDDKGLERGLDPAKNVMLAERNKEDVTKLAMTMNGMRFVAVGVTPENADAFKQTIGRIMMAVNIHLDETDEQIAHNTARAEIWEMGVKHGAALAAPSPQARDAAIALAIKQMRERNAQKPEQQKPLMN